MPMRPPLHRPPGWKSDAQRRAAYEAERPSSTARGYDAAWRVLRDAYLASNPICQFLGCGLPATDVDHIISKRVGGADDPTNLQSLCHRHHSAKTARTDGGFGNPRHG